MTRRVPREHRPKRTPDEVEWLKDNSWRLIANWKRPAGMDEVLQLLEKR